MIPYDPNIWFPLSRLRWPVSVRWLVLCPEYWGAVRLDLDLTDCEGDGEMTKEVVSTYRRTIIANAMSDTCVIVRQEIRVWVPGFGGDTSFPNTPGRQQFRSPTGRKWTPQFMLCTAERSNRGTGRLYLHGTAGYLAPEGQATVEGHEAMLTLAGGLMIGAGRLTGHGPHALIHIRGNVHPSETDPIDQAGYADVERIIVPNVWDRAPEVDPVAPWVL